MPDSGGAIFESEDSRLLFSALTIPSFSSGSHVTQEATAKLVTLEVSRVNSLNTFG